MDDIKKQIFGHLFRAAGHALNARESAATRPATQPAQKGAQRSPALAKPPVLKRPPSCCAVKVGGGRSGGHAGG